MKISELYTPAILLDLDAMQDNLTRYAAEAKKYGKQIWPMLKTHKSLELAKAQVDAGATGFLCGTLDEAECLAEHGYEHLMYAYPVATDVSIGRALKLAAKCDFIIRLDDPDGAALINAAAARIPVPRSPPFPNPAIIKRIRERIDRRTTSTVTTICITS